MEKAFNSRARPRNNKVYDAPAKAM